MAEQNKQNVEETQPRDAQSPPAAPQLDAAGKSLSEALRISFKILKMIMAVLVVLFLASGFFTVGPNEQALVLRFGKIRGAADERILNPGPHWAFPYPIDEIVEIPITKVQVLSLDDFWYFQTEEEKLAEASSSTRQKPPQPTLDLLRGDGYCITRNDSIATVPGNDYNIVHCKAQLTWRVDNPEFFFRNIKLESPQPGQSFADVIPESVAPLLNSVTDDVIVTTLVKFSIDEAVRSEADIADNVTILLQNKLDQIESGIKVVSFQLTPITWPRQVDDAFQQSIQASQESDTLVVEAGGYARSILNEAGGPEAEEILAALKDTALSETQKDLLWSRVLGTARKKNNEARAYKTTVVESAEANARYLKELLPEYRKYPELVLQRIYQDTVEYVLDNAYEKIILEPAASKQPRQIRLRITKDPSIKPKEK